MLSTMVSLCCWLPKAVITQHLKLPIVVHSPAHIAQGHFLYCVIPWNPWKLNTHILSRAWHTVYAKKYAHSFCFDVLCCGYTLTDFPISIRLTSLALWQSNDCPSASKATLMNMDKYFMWIHYERLHNHNKAKHNKTVCIFHGIYCMIIFWYLAKFLDFCILYKKFPNCICPIYSFTCLGPSSSGKYCTLLFVNLDDDVFESQPNIHTPQISWQRNTPPQCHFLCSEALLSGTTQTAYKPTQITKFMGPTWGPSGSWWPQMGPMLAPWTLLSWKKTAHRAYSDKTEWKHNIMYMIYIFIYDII